MWTSGTLHICELCIYVLEFAHLQNFCRFSNFGKLLALPPDGRHGRLRRHLGERAARCRSNKESVFCRKLSKIYPPCQNPDRSSYRLSNRLARKARVIKWSGQFDTNHLFLGSVMEQPTRASWSFACSKSVQHQPLLFKEEKMKIVTDRRRPGLMESRSCCRSSSSRSSGWKSENKWQMLPGNHPEVLTTENMNEK